MSQQAQPIKYGSIIHLKNDAPNGGYLGSSRSVIEEDVLNWQDPAVLTFIFTHLFENQSGSSSWEIVPDPNPNRYLIAVPGVADESDRSLVSLRVNEPNGAYVVATQKEVYLTKNLDASGMKFLATFRLVSGLSGQGKSFQSYNWDNYYLRHSGFKLRLNEQPKTTDQIFLEDASFNLGGVNNNNLIQSVNFPDRSLNPSVDQTSVQLTNVSAERKIGDVLQYGDRFRLRNMHPDAAFLDIFDWVDILGAPFNDYKAAMQNGVFTLDTAIRPAPYNVSQAEWTVLSADDKSATGSVNEGAQIRLKHNWLTSRGFADEQSFLTSYKRLSDNRSFDEAVYEGERMFVFVGPKAGQSVSADEASSKWTISHSNSSQNFYHLWGQVDGAWLDFGSFQINKQLSKSLISLKASTVGQGTALQGKVSYAGEGILSLEATQKDGNVYDVQHRLNNAQLRDTLVPLYPNGDWVFGARKDIKVVALDITSADGGRTFAGFIQYDGEDRIPIRGSQPSTKTFTEDNQPLFFDFFESGLWKKRIKQIEDSLVLSVTRDNSATVSNQLHNIYALWDCMQLFWQSFNDAASQTIDRLEAQNILLPVDTLSSIIRQFTIDFEIVGRAIQQRQAGSSTINSQTGTVQSNSLLVTDDFAMMSLAPIKKWLANGVQITPITFFSKSIHVRQLPYTKQFIFIGLTYDLTAAIANFLTAQSKSEPSNILPFELMAIPHEVGHFVYHSPHAISSARPSNKIAKEYQYHDDERYSHSGYKHKIPQPDTLGWLSSYLSDNPFHRWCEEIFADLYGCLVSGPLTALGIQAVLATGAKERLMLDDELHPTPIFRPYLISEMLRILADANAAWADFRATAMILDANWTAILDRWGILMEDVYNGRPARIIVPTGTLNHLQQITEINIAQMIEDGRKIIEAFSNVLFNIKPNGNQGYERFAEIFNISGTDAEKRNQVNQIVQEFEKFNVELNGIPWIKKQNSESLHSYANSFAELISAALSRGGNSGVKLSGKVELTTEVQGLIKDDSTDNANVVEVGEKAFRKLLAGWHDSGPRGGNFGG